MGRLRNLRQEKFAIEYVLCGGNAAEAYRRTWATFSWPNKGLLANARHYGYAYLNRPPVRARIGEVRDIVAKKSDITMDKVLTDLQEAITMARGMSKPNDMINGALAQAKLVGLLKERIETGAPGAFDESENVSDILQAVADKQGPQAALILAKQFGLELEKIETAKEKKATPDELIIRKPPTDSVN